MLRKIVDVGSRDLRASGRRRPRHVSRVGSNEVFGEVVKDGRQPVIFVKPWQSPSCELVIEDVVSVD
jgi:hypothetical protein